MEPSSELVFDEIRIQAIEEISSASIKGKEGEIYAMNVLNKTLGIQLTNVSKIPTKMDLYDRINRIHVEVKAKRKVPKYAFDSKFIMDKDGMNGREFYIFVSLLTNETTSFYQNMLFISGRGFKLGEVPMIKETLKRFYFNPSRYLKADSRKANARDLNSNFQNKDNLSLLPEMYSTLMKISQKLGIEVSMKSIEKPIENNTTHNEYDDITIEELSENSDSIEVIVEPTDKLVKDQTGGVKSEAQLLMERYEKRVKKPTYISQDDYISAMNIIEKYAPERDLENYKFQEDFEYMIVENFDRIKSVQYSKSDMNSYMSNNRDINMSFIRKNIQNFNAYLELYHIRDIRVKGHGEHRIVFDSNDVRISQASLSETSTSANLVPIKTKDDDFHIENLDDITVIDAKPVEITTEMIKNDPSLKPRSGYMFLSPMEMLGLIQAWKNSHQDVESMNKANSTMEILDKNIIERAKRNINKGDSPSNVKTRLIMNVYQVKAGITSVNSKYPKVADYVRELLGDKLVPNTYFIDESHVPEGMIKLIKYAVDNNLKFHEVSCMNKTTGTRFQLWRSLSLCTADSCQETRSGKGGNLFRIIYISLEDIYKGILSYIPLIKTRKLSIKPGDSNDKNGGDCLDVFRRALGTKVNSNIL